MKCKWNVILLLWSFGEMDTKMIIPVLRELGKPGQDVGFDNDISSCS